MVDFLGVEEVDEERRHQHYGVEADELEREPVAQYAYDEVPENR